MVFLYTFLVVVIFYSNQVSRFSLLLAFSLFLLVSYVSQRGHLIREKYLFKAFHGKPEPRAYALDSDGVCVLWSPEAEAVLKEFSELSSVDIFCSEMCDGCLYWAYDKQGYKRFSCCGASPVSRGHTGVYVRKIFGNNLVQFIERIKGSGYQEVILNELKNITETLQNYKLIKNY